MAASLNFVQVIGNLTRDPEVRQTPNGQTVATIGIATNRKWTNKQTNEKQEEVEFHNVVVWGKLAEICQQYLKKGAKTYFQGRLKTRNWEDPDGKKNYRTEIIAENMIMLDSRGGAAPTASQPAASQPAASQPAVADPVAQQTPPPVAEEEEVRIDDLPF
ncbi:single-stranded DNA-binding protein [Candidatus Gracilibacteria bacterium]|nr:single-stranded DNA-binding protein [Candidatus Gracilibacteria bacterium]MCF7856228.1 single-stranded DNA-binding protein [Candidatus Gracilibacteria bacterium]MCF7896707.1 single-stranded DNA-binding protein [Candidatus Gracilibacteria bacterium]